MVIQFSEVINEVAKHIDEEEDVEEAETIETAEEMVRVSP